MDSRTLVRSKAGQRPEGAEDQDGLRAIRDRCPSSAGRDDGAVRALEADGRGELAA